MVDVFVWFGLGAAILIGIGTFSLFRSFKRWQQKPPTDADTIQAEARLWSTRPPGPG